MTTNAAVDEPLLDTFDIIVLGAVLVATLAYFIHNKRQNNQNGFVKVLNGASNGTYSAPQSGPSTPVGNPSSFVDRMQAQGKDVVIFYGSQTGTAEDFASRMAMEAKLYGFNPLVADLEEFEIEDLERMGEVENGLAIFALATYGEGDPTDNAIDFHQWLKDDCNGADLSGLRYTVFSLGNSTYEHYQAMGRLADKMLKKAGATCVFARGEGDDDKSIEDDFCAWKKELWPALCAVVGREVPKDVENAILARQYKLVQFTKPPSKIYTGELGRHRSIPFPRSFVPDVKNPQLVPVRTNRELFAEGLDRSCRHVELDISGTNIRYMAGDHVAVFPTNDAAMVEELGTQLGVNLDEVFSLEAVDSGAKRAPFPVPCTYRTAFSHYLDISQLPKPHHLRELSQYADGTDKEFLLRMSSDAGHDEYLRWVQHDMRTFAEVIRDLPTLRPDPGHMVEMLPKLQCRYYSISSSPKAHPGSVHVTAVVVEYRTPLGREAKGVATTYLRGLDCSGAESLPKVPVYVRHSNFRLPKSVATPIVMIGPGTGFAPFRGFLQDRWAEMQKGGIEEPGETILFYGCRKRDEDYLYREEIEQYVKDKVITQLEVAFSREQAHKVYVTHRLEQQGEAVWRCIDKGGYLYVCGDAKNMARDVHNVLRGIIMEYGGLDEQKAEEYIQTLHAKGRYEQDVWS